MRKQWPYWTGTLGLALLLLGAAIALIVPRDRITSRNCASIGEGMSLADVERLLGGPAHESEPIIRTDPDTDEAAPTGAVIRRWFGRDGSIVLASFADGTVAGAVYYPADGRWAALRRRLGL